jgi:hypothetical protein
LHIDRQMHFVRVAIVQSKGKMNKDLMNSLATKHGAAPTAGMSTE